MRIFYEEWDMLDGNSSVTTDKTQNTESEQEANSSVATDELKRQQKFGSCNFRISRISP